MPLALAALLVARTGFTQQPAQPDTGRRDTSGIRLPEVTVTVTRTEERLERVPAAVGVLNSRQIGRGRMTVGLDEALNDLPGVYVANRYNFSLDQRLSIRGFGSRSNFGIRGIKVLLDGVPQTLPDGQSQLTNVDLAGIGRVEVLRGSASSLYGNASGGVIALSSEPAFEDKFGQLIRLEGGTSSFYKLQSRTSGRSGPADGTLTVSHTRTNGFRQQSAAEITQLNAGLNYLLSNSTTSSLRFAYGDQPQAQNPGALTLAEYLANPDSAARNNILRAADKNVHQGQLALALRHFGGEGGEISATIFGVTRTLKNPLAAPPPSGTGPTVGTYVEIDRQVVGLRLSGTTRRGGGEAAPRFAAGVDVQRMRDNRRNSRATAGVPDTLILDQRETVTELGPFAQLTWAIAPKVSLSTGVRYDLVSFDVLDHHLSDSVDNSGSRTMKAVSGHLAASYYVGAGLVPYANASTSFETPTTTELANQPNSTGGFNTGLKPQHAVNLEAGARGRVGRHFGYTIAVFASRITDAIVQYTETGGRAYFTNAGKLHNDGLELGLNGSPFRGIELFGSYTYAHYRFAEYRILNGTAVDTLDGRLVPGVPKAFIRLGLRASFLGGGSLDIDHTMSSSLFADDQNTIVVGGWGRQSPTEPGGIGIGVTNVRVAWEARRGRASGLPFVAINNLWNRRYVGSLTLNGLGGRVFEPAPGRNFYIGAELGWNSHPARGE